MCGSSVSHPVTSLMQTDPGSSQPTRGYVSRNRERGARERPASSTTIETSWFSYGFQRRVRRVSRPCSKPPWGRSGWKNFPIAGLTRGLWVLSTHTTTSDGWACACWKVSSGSTVAWQDGETRLRKRNSCTVTIHYGRRCRRRGARTTWPWCVIRSTGYSRSTSTFAGRRKPGRVAGASRSGACSKWSLMISSTGCWHRRCSAASTGNASTWRQAEHSKMRARHQRRHGCAGARSAARDRQPQPTASEPARPEGGGQIAPGAGARHPALRLCPGKPRPADGPAAAQLAHRRPAPPYRTRRGFM